jgi:hypothetical protein
MAAFREVGIFLWGGSGKGWQAVKTRIKKKKTQ